MTAFSRSTGTGTGTVPGQANGTYVAFQRTWMHEHNTASYAICTIKLFYIPICYRKFGALLAEHSYIYTVYSLQISLVCECV